MKCPKCGTEFSEGIFCPECGARCETQVNLERSKNRSKNAGMETAEKKKSKLPIIVGAIIAVIVLFIALSLGGTESSESVSDLGDYLPKGHDDVMKLVSNTGMDEETPGFYTNDDLRITTDTDGLIDTMTLKTSKYSLYGIKVGDEYSYDHFFKVLGDHSYVMIYEDENEALWGITSGDQDRLISFELYSGKIDTILFMRHGAYDVIASNTSEEIQPDYHDSSTKESFEEQSSNSNENVSEDPLQGLVSDDILTTFRSENEIGLAHPTDDPVFNEAGVLGIWVRYETEGDMPDEVYRKGQHIIDEYGWLFMNYSSQTLEDNMPNIYGYYYALKNESQSGQGEDGETYKLLQMMYSDGGFPQELGRFENECQEFITDCNNLVRVKRGL